MNMLLYVTVEDDGTRRDGYASYLCEVLNEKKTTTNWVKVVKLNSANDPNADNAYGVLNHIVTSKAAYNNI